MIILTILAILGIAIPIIILLSSAVSLIVGGAALIIKFGNIILCGLIIVILIKIIINVFRNKKTN